MYSELLAPAKDKETAIEAINCGADAVYIGASSFGARQNASNSIKDIEEVVKYAHKYYVKVFVTVNTILTDSELDEAVELVKNLDKIGADAVLVQDMGLLLKLINLNLKIPLHMSTQCDNRDLRKIDFFNKIGVSRVVLARELSLQQILEIHKQNPDLELENFIHGALCVSYSGQCYLSEYIGGRSANRGECAQPCRKKYSVVTDKGEIIAKNIHALCLKDFNASNHIKEMLDSGIFSFKIEGRLKDKGYVKNIVSYYRQELDKYSKKTSSGKSVYPFVPNPEKSFNRGFTDYFLKKRTDCFNFLSPKSRGEYIGKILGFKNNGYAIETQKNINPQDGICFYAENELSGFKVNRVEVNKNQTIIYPNKFIKLETGTKLYRNQDVEFEKRLSLPVKRQIGVNIEVINDCIVITDEDNNKITVKIPSDEIANNQEKMRSSFVKQFNKTGESDFYIKDIKINSEIPFMSISAVNELRRNVFDKLIEERIKNYKRQTQKAITPAPYYIKELDYRANIHNNCAKDFYEKCGCKIIEPSFESKKPKRQVELMRTKHCIKYALNMCKTAENLILVDEFGTKYPLKFDCKNCEMCVLSPIN